ncbi:hypothetical protein [Brucella intermedia]|uniref:Uncharacterized protein n=1 Tax=Brucella intermedia M86 TaxID=1234597 RepID=M5JSQ0_9HYPH|nr:hypothetical protein [Brucella intermedia]ELT51210.1 hypothetical protein D584_00135 [Brucella intermedia M86]
MSDFNYVNLYAKVAGFRIMVMANRIACTDNFSRAAHDTLVGKLDELIKLARETIAAQCKLALHPDSPEADDLGEQIWGSGQDLTYNWREPDGIDFRIVARNAGGEYENRAATAEEKAETCRAIYFESESDFTDEKTADLYLIWQAAAELEAEAGQRLA